MCGGGLLSLEVRTRLRGLTAACEGALLSLEVESRLRGLQLCVMELCSAWRLMQDWGVNSYVWRSSAQLGG